MKIKKLLMIAATTAALSSSAFAEMENNPENMFYAKVNAGANRMQNVSLNGIKAKTKTTAIFMVGVGYYAMDNLRTDLTFEIVNNPQFKGSGMNNAGKNANGNHKGTVGALMANAYVDMFDVSIAGIFAGAGVGAAKVKDKYTETIGGVATANSCSSKSTTNFAYQLTVGATGQVGDGVKAELAYSWRDYGKTANLVDGVNKMKKIGYKGHNLIAGVKFDL
ncbi:MAG: porin family protein [Rickettsiaceae bacterium]|nr:MAG: porin family protein [Rickettsiaceae bacterium]